MKIKVYQDCDRFYDDTTGLELFKSSYVVDDTDMRAAGFAREEFERVYIKARPDDTFEWV